MSCIPTTLVITVESAKDLMSILCGDPSTPLFHYNKNGKHHYILLSTGGVMFVCHLDDEVTLAELTFPKKTIEAIQLAKVVDIQNVKDENLGAILAGGVITVQSNVVCSDTGTSQQT